MPEPIYRLRFDARTPPLPIVRGSGKEAAEEPPPAPEPPVVPADAEDVTPQNEVAEMVDRERQSGASGSEKDLLDNRRPVE